MVPVGSTCVKWGPELRNVQRCCCNRTCVLLKSHHMMKNHTLKTAGFMGKMGLWTKHRKQTRAPHGNVSPVLFAFGGSEPRASYDACGTLPRTRPGVCVEVERRAGCRLWGIPQTRGGLPEIRWDVDGRRVGVSQDVCEGECACACS